MLQAKLFREKDALATYMTSVYAIGNEQVWRTLRRNLAIAVPKGILRKAAFRWLEFCRTTLGQ